jgi:hypothetical protein
MLREKSSGLYLLKCDHVGCREEIEISAVANPPGWMPVDEIQSQADWQGWYASIINKGHDACPQHRVPFQK